MKLTQPQVAVVEAACERAHDHLPPEHGERAAEWIRRYYRWVAPDDLEGRGVLDVYGAALAHLNFAEQREPGTTKVRVYNPAFETDGWHSTHTAVEVVTDDMPFLIDSVVMELTRQGFAVHGVIHPVIRVRRDDEGRLLGLDAADDALAESVIHVEAGRHTDSDALENLRRSVTRVIGEVRAAVEDWRPMRTRALEIAADLERNPPRGLAADDVEEAAAFLKWLEDHHFTFLGYREYTVDDERLSSVPGTGLGILRDDAEAEPTVHDFGELPEDARRRALEPYLLNLTKANTRATVHRPAYLDYVGVKRFDDEGRVTGERRFLGLYTTAAYYASPREIPTLRRKVDAILARADFPPDSHNEKALIEIIEAHPRDELLQATADELFEIAMGIVHLGERQRLRLFVRRDAFGRFLSCLVFVPRDRFNTDNRRRIERILSETFGATSVDYTTRVSESVLVRLHYTLYVGPEERRDVDVDAVEAQLVAATRTWTDDLEEALVEQEGEERGLVLHRRYADAFPAAYRADWLAQTAPSDIRRLEELEDDNLSIALYRPLEAPHGALRAKLFRTGAPLSLSGVLPLFENMGVSVADERPYEVTPRDGRRAWIYDFGLHYDGDLDAGAVLQAFQDAFVRAWRGEVENDGHNRLVLSAGLTWREVTVVRAIARYLRQGGTTFSDHYVADSLQAHPGIARLIVELFHARFDPATADERAAADLVERIEVEIDAVEGLDQDRILRQFLAVVRAMLRTNYFQGGGKPYLSFKLDPAGLPFLPKPLPAFEIFVYSPVTEGVHLRGGKVARGGLRWSDRREDFRTEVLGLMKAQMVKNSVIVPVGAKGGFVVKRAGAEVVDSYRTFIQGLLDLTDNIVDGEVVPPPDVVRYDDDDPYLVVAADRGTATFSDIANAVAGEYGFWLGDAFASGGSTGYDHKKMGITAKGAWESVKRHFREVGHDVQSEDLTVVGIGDMSGDVFGNGMLLSRHIRLIAAFDHRHVFLDPDPDAAASFEERRRLFELPASTWADYDAALISDGGGVFPRSAKSIPLSAQVREALAVEAESLPPNEMIRAILRAPVDLLWNGGIGTYVKATGESHAEAGDKAGDAVRVDASELRCRVVGEGGNLGMTQRARIEYALAGGRLNTDAIDNSAGVDCSDHEVNIKVLLDAACTDGDLTVKQRNALLVEMTDAVADAVLKDNYEQTETLSMSEAQAGGMIDVHQRLIRALEQEAGLDRALEFLPDDEALADRKREHRGLTRPELATLLAYAKIHLYRELLDSPVPEDEYLSAELAAYFPDPLPERFGDLMGRHRLRREIIATQVVNNILHGGGTTFSFRLHEETGARHSDIARAYTVAREVFRMRPQWAEIEALDNEVDAETQTLMLLGGRRLIERGTRWVLRNRARPLAIAPTVERYAPGAAELYESLPRLLAPADREALAKRAATLREKGVSPELAARVASLREMVATFDVTDVAAEFGLRFEDVAGVHFRLGDDLQLHWLRDRIVALPREDRWSALARSALRDDLYALHRALTAEILKAGATGDAEMQVQAWIADNPAAERCLETLADIRVGRVYDMTTLPVAVREVRNLIQQA